MSYTAKYRTTSLPLKAFSVDYFDQNPEELYKDEEMLDFLSLVSTLAYDKPPDLHKESINSSMAKERGTQQTPLFFTDDPGDLIDEEDNSNDNEEVVSGCGEKVNKEETREVDNRCDEEVNKKETKEVDSGCGEKVNKNEIEVVKIVGGGDGSSKVVCELHRVSPSLITPAPCWWERGPEVVSFIPPTPEDDYPARTKQKLGFEFPGVMGNYVEEMVWKKWEELRKKGVVGTVEESRSQFNSVLVRAQVNLMKLAMGFVKRKRSDTLSRERKIPKLKRDLRDVARNAFGRLFVDIEDDNYVSSDNSVEIFHRSRKKRKSGTKIFQCVAEKSINTQTSSDESDHDSQDGEISSKSTPKQRRSPRKQRKLRKKVSSKKLTPSPPHMAQTTLSCDKVSKIQKGVSESSVNPECGESTSGIVGTTSSEVSPRRSERLMGKSQKMGESPYTTIQSYNSIFYEDVEDINDIIAQTQSDETLIDTKVKKDEVLLSSDSEESSMYEPSSLLNSDSEGSSLLSSSDMEYSDID